MPNTPVLRSARKLTPAGRLSSCTHHKPTASALIQFLRGYFAHQGISKERIEYRSDYNGSAAPMNAALKNSSSAGGEEAAVVHVVLIQKGPGLGFTVKAQMLPNQRPGYSISVKIAGQRDTVGCCYCLESMEDVYEAYRGVRAYLHGR